MAHDSADDHGQRRSGDTDREKDAGRNGDGSPDKVRLNRREYVKWGAATVAATIGPATGLTSAATTQSFTTDFSEYAQ